MFLCVRYMSSFCENISDRKKILEAFMKSKTVLICLVVIVCLIALVVTFLNNNDKSETSDLCIETDGKEPYKTIAAYIDRKGLQYDKLLSLADKHYPQRTVLQLAHVASQREMIA